MQVRIPVTTGVAAVTLAVSLSAMISPQLMALLIRDRPQLQGGQWWRIVTPVLVQPSGWGQLVFNMLGIICVGAVLEQNLRWQSWSLVYWVGGVASIALYSAWHPADTGGGSSAAVAAMIGALAVIRMHHPVASRLDRAAQLYSVFFAAYLTALTLGGVILSVLVGSLSIALMVPAGYHLDPAVLTRISIALVLVAGVVLVAARDDHGTGILIGAALASLVRAYHGIDHAAGHPRHMSGPAGCG